jgi:hypothetical protein
MQIIRYFSLLLGDHTDVKSVQNSAFDARHITYQSVMITILQRAACDALTEAVKRHWARYGHVEIRYELVTLESLYSVVSMVAECRFERAMRIVEEYQLAKISPFLPAIYSQSGDGDSVGFGPLIERNGHNLVLLDGVHRSLGAQVRGLKRIYAATINAQFVSPTVGALCQLETIKISCSPEAQVPLFAGKGFENFRPAALFTKTAAIAIISQMEGNKQ